MKELTLRELTIIFNLTAESTLAEVERLHEKVRVELSYRGAFL